MTSPRTLAVQSVLYGTEALGVRRAAEAVAHSVGLARQAGLVGDWVYLLGDCSPEPVLSDADRREIEKSVGLAGGVFREVVFGENLGSAAGHNRLAALDAGELLLILNPDAQTAPDAITELARALRDGVGIAEARQVPLEHPKDFDAYTGDTSWASTACALTPRAVFDTVGGFDSETFFLYCDDVDYSWRVRLAGYRVVFTPSATVHHDKRLTVTGDWPASSAERYYSAEAALLIAHKYSHPEIVAKLSAALAKSPDELERDAAAAFAARRADGRLPVPLDPRHRVAQFVEGNYARHRF